MDVVVTDEARDWIKAKGGAAVVDVVACTT